MLEKEKQLNQRKEVIKSDLPATAPANVYPTNPLFNMDIHAPVVHKKSHSMDSQVVAASRPNSAGMYEIVVIPGQGIRKFPATNKMLMTKKVTGRHSVSH